MTGELRHCDPFASPLKSPRPRLALPLNRAILRLTLSVQARRMRCVAEALVMRFVLCMIAALLVSTAAQAQIYHANDTGGIIPWSCENEADAQAIAAAYCARWDKYHRITSVHRQYGDYIAFACLWSPYVNRYAIPAVRTRATCYREHGIVVKALN
jgi:hypothetical protein